MIIKTLMNVVRKCCFFPLKVLSAIIEDFDTSVSGVWKLTPGDVHNPPSTSLLQDHLETMVSATWKATPRDDDDGSGQEV